MEGEFDAIRAAGDVDARWLTVVLAADGVGVGNEVVEIVASSIGTGQVGENVRYELTWREADADLPASVVGKFPTSDPEGRAKAAAVGTYAREAGFYRDIVSDVSIRTPHVHHFGWEPATNDFAIVMEDITPSRAGDQLAGCTVADAELAIDAVVGLHAPTWGDVDRYAGHDWLSFPGDERTAGYELLLEMTHPGFVERYRGRLSDDDLDLGTTVVERYRELMALTDEWASGPGSWCIAHGDYRLDNLLFGCGGEAPPLTVVDWQTTTVATGPSDVAYFLGAGLAPADRRDHERALVARYAAAMRDAGVELSDDVAWDGYALGSAGGYLMAAIASQLVARTERGDEMFAVMAERHAAQMRDVDLVGRLDRSRPT